MTLIISLLVVATLVVFHSQAKDMAIAATEAVFRIPDSAARLLGASLGSTTNWLKTEDTRRPLLVLAGVLVLAASVAVSFADFKILRLSLALVWPTTIPPDWIAFSVVMVTGTIALLLHLTHHPVGRAGLLLLAIFLLSIQGLVAYSRAAQLGEIRKMEAGALTNEADSGHLVINNQSSPSPEKHPEQGQTLPGSFEGDLAPILSAILAVLLSLGEIVCVWGAFSLAQGGIAWMICLPAIALLALPWAIFRFLVLCRFEVFLVAAFSALFDAFGAVKNALTRLLLIILPASWTQPAFQWWCERERRRHELREQLRDADSAATVLEQARKHMEKDQENSFREFLEACAMERRAVSRNLIKQASESSNGDLSGAASRLRKLWLSQVTALEDFEEEVRRKRK